MNSEIWPAWEDWVKVSFAVGALKKELGIHLVPVIQNLGRLDAQLRAFDAEIVDEFRSGRREEWAQKNVSRFNDHTFHSYLWVLSGYEVIRTLCDQARKRKGEIADNACAVLLEAKRLFERVRIPLAKLESPGKFPEDSPIAWPIVNYDHGMGWAHNEHEFTTRQSLSDVLYAALKQLHSGIPEGS